MKTIWDNLISFYSNTLHPVYDKLISILVNNQYVIIILIVIIVVYSIFRGRMKGRVLTGVADFIIGITFILLMLAAYSIFEPAISKFIKTNIPDTTNNGTTDTNGGTKQNTAAPAPVPTQTQSQTQKQLYYYVTCSSCWAEGCPRNGYSYGGYDAYYYSYYYGVCKSCSCNDFKAQSFWK